MFGTAWVQWTSSPAGKAISRALSLTFGLWRQHSTRTAVWKLFACRTVSVLVLLLGLFWMDAAEAQVASHDKPVFTLTVREGRLSADINRIPLRLVLEELARQAALRVSVNEAAADYPVSEHFSALALSEALARLLAGYSYAIIYDASTSEAVDSAATTRVVEVLGLGSES